MNDYIKDKHYVYSFRILSDNTFFLSDYSKYFINPIYYSKND